MFPNILDTLQNILFYMRVECNLLIFCVISGIFDLLLPSDFKFISTFRFFIHLFLAYYFCRLIKCYSFCFFTTLLWEFYCVFEFCCQLTFLSLLMQCHKQPKDVPIEFQFTLQDSVSHLLLCHPNSMRILDSFHYLFLFNFPSYPHENSETFYFIHQHSPLHP